MSRETFYFSHDYNARTDPRLMRVLMKHGTAGLGIYWCIIEMLYEQSGYIPLINIESIAFELHTECERIKSVLQEFDLFKFRGEVFYSESVLRRLKMRDDKSEGARQSALKRWYPDKYKDAKAMRSQCDANAIKERKGKERTEKENKENIINIPFDIFWNLYDKKTDRIKCEKKWNALTDTERKLCIEKLPAYIKSTPDKQYRRHPETYLNNKSWENEIVTGKNICITPQFEYGPKE